MGAFIQGMIIWYFGILGQSGLLWVVILMAMESSIFPVPSELVVPPAAVSYLTHNSDGSLLAGQLSLRDYFLVLLVILAGTLGSYIGAGVTYWISRWLGRPLVVKYGKYFLVSPKKLAQADRWMVRYGAAGIFIARLLPVVRHIISIPAGVVGMRFRTFSMMTLIGSFIWCSVLAVFGVMMRADITLMIDGVKVGAKLSEDVAFRNAFQTLTLGTLILVGVATGCYWLLARRQKLHSSTALREDTISEVVVHE